MILWFWFYDTLSCDLIRSRRFAQQASYPNHETVLWLDIKKNHLPKLNSRLRNCSLSESGWGIERLLLDLALCNLERENF